MRPWLKKPMTRIKLMVERLSSMGKALGLIPSIMGRKKREPASKNFISRDTY
jgi:hypothetical protein